MRIIYEMNQEFKHKCKYCKSIYAYTHKDVDHSFFEFLRCPVCNSLDHISIFDRKIKGVK